MSSTCIGLSTVSSHQTNETLTLSSHPTNETDQSRSSTVSDHFTVDLDHILKHSRSKPNILSDTNTSIDYCGDCSCSESEEYKDGYLSYQLQRRSIIYNYHKIGTDSNANNNATEIDDHALTNSKLFTYLLAETTCKERKFLYFALLCTLCTVVLQLVFYIFFVDIIDGFGDYETYTGAIHSVCDIHPWFGLICGVHIFIVTLFIICILISLIKLAQNLSTAALAASFLSRLNCTVFDKVINQSLSFFDKTDKMYLNKSLADDIKHINSSIYSLIVMINNMVYLLGGIIFLFIVNWDIALIIICGLIVVCVIVVIYGKKNVAIDRLRSDKFVIVGVKIAEMLKYIKTIKTFSKEDDESYIYQRCIKDAYECDTKRNTGLYQCHVLLDIIKYITVLVIMIIGIESHMTLGILMIDLFVLLQLNQSIRKIVEIILLFADKYIQSAQNICTILNNYKVNPSISIHSTNQKINNKEIEGDIKMNNVQFAYPKRINKLVLKNICVKFEPSSITALVGVCGAGKSTILQLLMRFFDPQKGQILIDNIDIKKYNEAFLHSNIGYIGQDLNIFEDRSITDNIKFAVKYDAINNFRFDAECFNDEHLRQWYQRKNIRSEHIETAARIANAYEFIQKLGQNNRENKEAEYCIKITRDIDGATLNQQERDFIIQQITNVIVDLTGYCITKGDMNDKYKSNIVLVVINTKNDTLNTKEMETILEKKLCLPVEIKEKLNYFQIGCETIIGGTYGVQLSHDEKVRIAMARAIVLNPKILLIDEANIMIQKSNADMIRKSLDSIMMQKNKCVVVIAHRLSTLRKAKHIYVINDGKINDCGTHNQLIKKNTCYAKLLQKHTFF